MDKRLRKNIISVATLATLALLAPMAQAQLTIYGRANIDFERISLSGTPAAEAFGGTQRVSSNSSRLGVRASKEYEGLTWIAQIESGISVDAGGDSLATRDTFAGVQGDFGKFRIGKMDTPFKDLGGLTDRFYGTGLQDDGSLAALGGSGNGFARRQNNSLRYDSPALGDVRAALQYGLDSEDKGTGEQKRILSLAVHYESGPYKAAVAHERHSNFNASGLTDSAWRLGAKADFGVFNLGVGFTRLSYELATGDAQRSYSTVTAGVPVGKGVINLRVGRAGDVSGSAAADSKIAGADGVELRMGTGTGANQFTLGYEYALFKGAVLYTYWTKIANAANANYRFGFNGVNLAAADRGADASAFVLGMSYDF